MQKFGGIDADANSSAYFGILRCLLVDIDGYVVVFAVVVEGEGSEETADAAADDGDTEGFIVLGSHCLLVSIYEFYVEFWRIFTT